MTEEPSDNIKAIRKLGKTFLNYIVETEIVDDD
jgi:hypothetical protein